MPSHKVQRRCPACQHPELFELAHFAPGDVSEKPTTDAVVMERPYSLLAPLLALEVLIFSALGNFFQDQIRVARGRSKVRRARAEVLPRRKV